MLSLAVFIVSLLVSLLILTSKAFTLQMLIVMMDILGVFMGLKISLYAIPKDFARDLALSFRFAIYMCFVTQHHQIWCARPCSFVQIQDLHVYLHTASLGVTFWY